MKSEDVQVNKVTFRKVFHIAAYGINETAEIEMQLLPGQTHEYLLDYAKSSLEDWHKQYESQIPVQQGIGLPVSVRPIKEDLHVERDTEEFEALKKTIEECPTKEIALKMISKSNFKYNHELKTLANGKAN